MLCLAFPKIEDIENLEIVNKLRNNHHEKIHMICNYVN